MWLTKKQKQLRSLRLRYVQRLAGHQAAVNEEHEHNGVELQSRAREPETAGNLVEYPALRDPVGHQGVDAQRSRNGGALEVARLAGGVVGDVSRRDVEARETSQAAKHEDSQEHVVDSGAQTETEGHTGGSKAEGNLHCHITSLAHVNIIMGRGEKYM